MIGHRAAMTPTMTGRGDTGWIGTTDGTRDTPSIGYGDRDSNEIETSNSDGGTR